MTPEECFDKWWKESGTATCYSSSQAKRRFKAAYLAGRNAGIEASAEVARRYRDKSETNSEDYILNERRDAILKLKHG